MIRVVNHKAHEPTELDVYIGRGSPLGNPYTGTKELKYTKATYQSSSRESSIMEYKEYLNNKINEKDELICNELNRIYEMSLNGGVNLVCYCKPKPCHGDVIKEIILAKIIKKQMKYGK